MRRLRLPHGVIKRYRRFPRPDADRFSPNSKPETGGTVQRGLGGNVESWRWTERMAGHDGGRGCPHKRERIMSST